MDSDDTVSPVTVTGGAARVTRNAHDTASFTGREDLSRLLQTQSAFDSVAEDYDGERGNNAAIQDMRDEMWRWLDALFPQASRLIDLGCGTGLDAVRMARRGHRITATDWSGEMVRRTLARARQEDVADRVLPLQLGAHELHRLGEDAAYDGVYSNLGPLNCAPDLEAVSEHCARLLAPGGILLFTVIGRLCPWELGHYLLRGQWSRLAIRYARGFVPVGLNQQTVWARYYTPRAFYRSFKRHFSLMHYRGLCVCVPPPYLVSFRQRHERWHRRLWRLDRLAAGWPLLRSMGDHFLIALRKRASS